MNRIELLFKKFEGEGALENPAGPQGEDDLSAFLRAMSASGDLGSFTEAEWAEFGKSQNLSDDQIAELIEQAAGWVSDTTKGGLKKPESAEWA